MNSDKKRKRQYVNIQQQQLQKKRHRVENQQQSKQQLDKQQQKTQIQKTIPIEQMMQLNPDPLNAQHTVTTTSADKIEIVPIPFENTTIMLPIYIPRNYNIVGATNQTQNHEWQPWQQQQLTNILTTESGELTTAERIEYTKRHDVFQFYQLFLQSKRQPSVYTIVFVKAHMEYDVGLQNQPQRMPFYQKSFYNEKLIYNIIINRFLEHQISPHFIFMYKSYYAKVGARKRKAFMLFEKGGNHIIDSSRKYRKEMTLNKSNDLHSFFQNYNLSNHRDQIILESICSNQFLFGIIYSLYCMQQCGLMHDDLHDGNILLDYFETAIPEISYQFDDMGVVFPNVRVIPKIIDFDRGTLVYGTIVDFESVPKSDFLIRSPLVHLEHKLKADGTKDLIRILCYIYWGLYKIDSTKANKFYSILSTMYNFRPDKTMSKHAKVRYQNKTNGKLMERTLETSWFGEAYFKSKNGRFHFLNDLSPIQRDGETFLVRPIQFKNMYDLLNLFHNPKSKAFELVWSGMIEGTNYFIVNQNSTTEIMYSTKSIPLVQDAIVEYFELV